MLAQLGEQKPTKIRIRELLRFFDEAPPESSGHATALAAVLGEDLGAGLLKHCLERLRGAQVDILLRAGGRPLAVTTGRQKGRRLDRWIRATLPDGTVTLFQAEIKSWSAHAMGGRRLEITAEPRHLSERAQHEWEGIARWLGGPVNSINKVLVPMSMPGGVPPARLCPLLIFWDVVQSEGQVHDCFFWHTLNHDQRPEGYEQVFDRLAVFSMSLYLRRLLAEGETEVNLSMPDTASRMQWLNAILRA